MRARELREVSLLSFFLPFFICCGTFDSFAAFAYNYSRNLKEAWLCEIGSITYDKTTYRVVPTLFGNGGVLGFNVTVVGEQFELADAATSAVPLAEKRIFGFSVSAK